MEADASTFELRGHKFQKVHFFATTRLIERNFDLPCAYQDDASIGRNFFLRLFMKRNFVPSKIYALFGRRFTPRFILSMTKIYDRFPDSVTYRQSLHSQRRCSKSPRSEQARVRFDRAAGRRQHLRSAPRRSGRQPVSWSLTVGARASRRAGVEPSSYVCLCSTPTKSIYTGLANYSGSAVCE